MPSTRFYGWPIEAVGDQPGITLHGGDPPSSPILAEEIERVVRALDLRIADLEAQVADLTTKVALAEETLIVQGNTQTVSNSTSPVDTNLTFDAEATATYLIRLRVRWQEPSSGGGFRATWAAPAGSSSLRAIVAPGQTTTGGPQALTESQIRAWSHNQEVFNDGSIGASTTHAWFEDLLLSTVNPGTVVFRFAQGESAAAAVTLHAASYLLYRRLA